MLSAPDCEGELARMVHKQKALVKMWCGDIMNGIEGGFAVCATQLDVFSGDARFFFFF